MAMVDMPTQAAEGAHKTSKDEALDLLYAEQERINAELRDIAAKINQSRTLMEQLAQKNAVVIGEVRRIESALEQTPRLSIKEVYTEALDLQQRLLTTRGQIEKLQAQEAVARQQKATVDELIEKLSQADRKSPAEESFNAREIIMRVIDAQEEERERVARQMHDGPAHSLTNFILQAEICEKLFERDPQKAREELVKLKASAKEAFQRVRDFIFDLRPMMLTDLGLVPTLNRYLEAVKEKTGIQTSFNLVGRERRLEGYREALVFRGIQAVMSNARDHGGATAIKVTLEMSDDRVRAIIEDNGRGPGTGRLNLDARNSQMLGLGALQERVRLVGGTLQVESMGGQGTRISITIPAGPEVVEAPLAEGV